MLHPINPPSCVNELLALVDLQKKTLEFAEANSTYSDAVFKAFVPIKFVDWLLNLKINGRKDAKKVATDFLNDLGQYVQYPQVEKRQVLADFIHDQSFYAEIDNPLFEFSLLSTKSIAHNLASRLLVKFYSLLGEGYPPELVGRTSGTSSFAKRDVIAGYVETNDSIEYVCPCCDNAYTTDNPRTINGQGCTIEHYFPKSIYPSLSLHPLNLIPMCDFCNNKKEDKDPLNLLLQPAPLLIPYEEVFHPYSRPVRNIATLMVTSNSTLPEKLEFKAKNPPPTYGSSIEAYSIIYQIPDRWNKSRTKVDNRVALYIRRVQRRFGGVRIDDRVFDQILQEAIDELVDSFGSDHLSYPAASWLTWARVNKFQDLKSSFVIL